ncbi:MAG: glycosyltransferase family 2 protein [Spartobacteria bacterium]|nr:glycosyltransferase family 2 protein [Spartobacteria bacterium]
MPNRRTAIIRPASGRCSGAALTGPTYRRSSATVWTEKMISVDRTGDTMPNNVTNEQPLVWAVTLGFNNAQDTIECLQSLRQSDYPNLRLLMVDNASNDNTVERVMNELSDVDVVRMSENVGFARGFNTAMTYALEHGADYVFMINNDTIVDPPLIARLVAAGRADPKAGVLTPKIYYYDHKDTVWSAGSRYRKCPPVIVIQKGKHPDRGEFDHLRDLEFVTTCALAFPRAFLEEQGLLDANFFFFSEDYDLSIRARQAGYALRFVPEARMWHKVSKSTKAGSPSPFFWFTYGRSSAIFCRKHRAFNAWMTGPAHLAYVLARMLAEGKHYGIKPFMKGWREGMKAQIKPIPKPGDAAVDRGTILRENGAVNIPPAGKRPPQE